MRRGEFIKLIAAAAIAAPCQAEVQAQPKFFRLGTVVPGVPLDDKDPLAAILLRALQQRGYALGKNLIFEARGAGGEVGKLPEVVRAMKAEGVEVIVAAVTRRSSPARWRRATSRRSTNTISRGCMAYGPDLRESFGRAADLTAHILAGAKPAELPFEEPTRYKLVTNLKIARATGIELPENFVALADEVIE